VAALQLHRFVDRGQDPVGGVSGPGDVCVRQDRQELRRGAAQHPGGVDVANRSRERRGHGLEGLLRRAGPVGLDQKHAEVSLVAVGPRQLVLEYWPHKTIVEESRGAIDNVKGFCLGVIGPDSARRAEDGSVRQGGPASQACLSFRPAAQEVANRHRAKAYQPDEGV
jgi:hypothetical protein